MNAVLDQRMAGKLKELLAPLLASGSACRIDAGGVTRLSTASIQVITAFLIAARDTGTVVTFSSISPAFRNAFEALGLGAQLESPHPDQLQ